MTKFFAIILMAFSFSASAGVWEDTKQIAGNTANQVSEFTKSQVEKVKETFSCGPDAREQILYQKAAPVIAKMHANIIAGRSVMFGVTAEEDALLQQSRLYSYNTLDSFGCKTSGVVSEINNHVRGLVK